MAKATHAIDLTAMRKAAARASGLLKVLGNQDRMMLLCQLSQGEHSVNALEAALGISQPTLSQQLAVLRDQKVVLTRREGKQIIYSVSSTEATAVLQLLYNMYCPDKEGSPI